MPDVGVGIEVQLVYTRFLSHFLCYNMHYDYLMTSITVPKEE